MSYDRKRKLVGVVLSIFIISASTSVPFRTLMTMPELIRLSSGQEHVLNIDLPFLRVQSDEEGLVSSGEWPLVISPMGTGEFHVEFRLFGIIPLRRIAVEVLPPMHVMPGGHSIGVLLHSHGVIVTNIVSVSTHDGRTYRPAQEGGLVVGDIILSVNGETVMGDEHLAALVEKHGQSAVQLEVRQRDGSTRTRSVTPRLCSHTNDYRLGVWVRDTTAGVGTLTFYEPDSGVFAALGHVVSNHDTGEPVSMGAGRIVASTVTRVEAGRRGQPGEVVGAFTHTDAVLGIIRKNTDVGIMGMMEEHIENPHFAQPIPVAMSREVQTGPAEIYTVIEGRSIDKYEVKIVEVRQNPLPYGRLVIKITDTELLQRTGGIIQGMSGSPIVQQGRLVGAITHVLVGDPSRGYGVSAEWMILESGIRHIASTRVGSYVVRPFFCKICG